MTLINDERTVAEILNDALEANPQIKQTQVAEAVNLPRPNVIYMFKTGKSKIPLDKAGRIASAVGLNAREFWFKCLKEYQPEVYAELERVNKQPTLTATEISFIKASRTNKVDLMAVLERESELRRQQGTWQAG